MIKKIAVLVVISGMIFSSCQKSKVAEISGFISNASTVPLLITDDYNHTADTIANKKGEFHTSFPLNTPEFNYLIFDKSRRELFLAPGYSLKLSFNNSGIETSVKIEGKGAIENNILDSIVKRTSKLNIRFMYNAPVEKGVQYIDSAFGSIQKYFDQLISSSDADPDFIEFENVSLTYQAAAFKTQIGLQKQIKDSSYYSFWKKLDINNDKYLSVPNYRSFLNCYLNIQTKQGLGWQDATSEDQFEDNYLDAVLSSVQKIENKKIREYFLFEKINSYIKADLLKDIGKYQHYFAANNTDSLYAKQLENTYSGKRSLSAGKNAPDFTIADTDNNQISLQDFRGRFVYIDFWATWCPPCIEEHPFFSQLETDYKDIIFLRISLDTDKNKWKIFLNKHKRAKNDLYAEKGTDSEIAKSYQIKGLPAFVLIDREGKIIQHRAPVPSSIEIRKSLDSLLGTTKNSLLK